MLVDELFIENWSATCMYDGCQNVITVAKFHVIRDVNLFYACCAPCYRRELKSGKPGIPKRADSERLRTWERHNGENVLLGTCFHCNVVGRKKKIHFYVDAWEAGHDIADKDGGSATADNMAPLHVRCNKNQKTKTFKEHLGQRLRSA